MSCEPVVQREIFVSHTSHVGQGAWKAECVEPAAGAYPLGRQERDELANLIPGCVKSRCSVQRPYQARYEVVSPPRPDSRPDGEPPLPFTLGRHAPREPNTTTGSLRMRHLQPLISGNVYTLSLHKRVFELFQFMCGVLAVRNH